jgi:peptidoglycan glycosyltransferase
VAASQFGDMFTASGQDDANLVAQSSIGQFDDRMTPLMGCMIASAIATGGQEMQPYLIDHVRTPTLQNSVVADPKVLRTPISSQVAGQLQDMMFSVVENGTARGARVDGYQVGGKTGTAQNGNGPDGKPLLNHRWFIGFVMKDGKPLVAISIFLKNAGSKGKLAPPSLAGKLLPIILSELGGS